MSSCRDTQKFFNSPDWEWKGQGCHGQGENSMLEFKYLHMSFLVLWDGRNENPQAFALQITFGNSLSFTQLVKVSTLDIR